MNEIINQPLVLNKKSKSSRFANWSGEGNCFYDKLLRVLYIFLLFAINFVMFIYSINSKLMDGGQYNQAVLYILGAFFVFSFCIILLLSFSKDLQNLVCAIFTMIFVAMFYHQFALFDVDNFVENWLSVHASWLTFICLIPSSWFVGLFLGILIFFLFRYTFFMLFISLVLLTASVLGVLKNENIENSQSEYVVVKELEGNVGHKRDTNVVYFMIPKFPSYQFLGTVRDIHFRELRNLMIGFFATNDFEIYPNAFVMHKNSMDNVVDIVNQVDYTSTTSDYRGFAEYINNWDFIHGGLNYYSLEDNKLYDHVRKEGYGVSTYAAPNFNTCLTGGGINTDRCVIKGYKTVSAYDENQTLERNIYTLITEWLVNMRKRDLKSLARELSVNSTIKGYKVTSENRRVSIEGATKVFDVLTKNITQDVGGHVYMVYADLPSDIYIYDQYCNLKPRKDWVALKDNSLVSVGIDLKRQAYAEQTKCLLGKLQGFLDELKEANKINKTDIFVQGVSPLKELSAMTAGDYGNFVVDKLVALGIRKHKNPKFLINANVCLASDFTKSLLQNQDFCFSVDNMKKTENEAKNLKKNLINNSVLRGGKITSIAINYKDWYESFKQNSIDYQAQIKMQKEAEVRRIDEAMKQLELEQKTKMMQEAYDKAQKENLSEENIFIPDDLIFDVSEKETVNNEDGVGYESTVNINEDVLVVDENLPLLTGETKDISADLDVIKENEIADKELNNIIKKEELEETIESLSEVLPEEVTKALEVMKKNDGNNLELKI